MTAAQGAIARTEIEKAKGFAVVSFTNRAAEGVSKRATESSPIVTLSEVDLAGFRDMLIDAAI
jgi:hypothetical protein